MIALSVLVSRFAFLLVSVLICTQSFAEKVFDFNINCRQAYEEIIQLKLNKGQQMLEQEKVRHPDNLIPLFLESYIDFFTLFFNEDPAEYRKRRVSFDKRSILIGQGPKTSPFYLFTKAVINFQWAAIRIKFGYNWDAGWQFRRSYLLLKDNNEAFPRFSPNLFYSGAMKVAASTIPDGYKWLSNLLGVKGSSKEGFRDLERFMLQKDDWSVFFRQEALFYYLFLEFYVNNDREAVFNYIRTHQLDTRNNHLFTYLAANLSINNQQSENAIKLIRERNVSADYLQTPIWDLELGYAMFNRLDSQSPVYLEKFLKDFKGTFYVKDVHQKLSWYNYLIGNQARAQYYRDQLLQKGKTGTDADLLAQKEAKSGLWPNKLLLQTRLLNDGGYYRDALRLLYGKTVSDFPLIEERLEFLYRVGRLYDDTGRHDEAIVFYKQAIAIGEKRQEYFAARAAMQLGYIFEQKGDKASALYWFRRCLSMDDHDFKNSLDQRAKAGITRCTG